MKKEKKKEKKRTENISYLNNIQRCSICGRRFISPRYISPNVEFAACQLCYPSLFGGPRLPIQSRYEDGVQDIFIGEGSDGLQASDSNLSLSNIGIGGKSKKKKEKKKKKKLKVKVKVKLKVKVKVKEKKRKSKEKIFLLIINEINCIYTSRICNNFPKIASIGCNIFIINTTYIPL